MPCPPEESALNAQMDKLREAEKEKEKESDHLDGLFSQHTETGTSHRRALEKQRYNTLGYQKKKQKLPVDFSTVSKGASGNTKSRGALKQVLFNQGSSEKAQEERGVAGGQEQVDALKEILDSFPVPADLSWNFGEDNSDSLENSWTDIVKSAESMSKTQRHQQEALWELIHTEYIYINKLTVITDFVLAALDFVHQRGFLLEVISTQLFSNLPDILNAHKLFWHQVLYPMLKNARISQQPFDPLNLEPGCLQFTERFSAYLDYCWEEERNVESTRRQLETNLHFYTFLTWVETHPQCMRMRVGDMQAKPHQRITKYPLLLKAILKTTQDPYTQQALCRMLTSVGQFLDSINDYLQFKFDELALLALSQRIEGYTMQGMNEEIDKYMQEFCRFDLTSPIRGIGPKIIRKLLLEETLKVRGRKDSKLEVVVLLFTDVLLLTKSQKKSDKFKIVRPPLSLERIHCAELKDGYSFVLVEVSDLGCAVSVYSVSAPSPEICTAWVSAIHQAQESLEALRKQQNQSKPMEPNDQLELQDSEETHSTQAPEEREVQPVGQPDELIIEPEERERSEGAHQGETDVQSSVINERRVTWNYKSMDSNNIIQEEVETSQPNGPHHLLVGGMMENATSNQTSSSDALLASGHISIEPAIRDTHQVTSMEKTKQAHSNDQSRETDSLKESLHSGEEDDLNSESWRFSRKLKSPKLRRKRPVNPQPSVANQDSMRMKLKGTEILPDRNSSSNSDSDGNSSFHRSSSSSKPQDSHLVLKLGSLKRNSSVFWNTERQSLDLHTLSEPELPNEIPQNSLKMPKMKSQRSASTPEVVYSHSQSFPLSVPKRLSPSPPPGHDSMLHPSPLQGLLERAKERNRERGMAKKEQTEVKQTEKSTISLQKPVSVSSKPSPSPSEGERKREHFSHSGRECSVDDPEKERKYSPVTPLGASVDWPGWCFDDEEVLEFLKPYNGTVELFDHTLDSAKCQETQKQEDGEYSEV